MNAAEQKGQAVKNYENPQRDSDREQGVPDDSVRFFSIGDDSR
jgi:hypothetical protein